MAHRNGLNKAKLPPDFVFVREEELYCPLVVALLPVVPGNTIFHTLLNDSPTPSNILRYGGHSIWELHTSIKTFRVSISLMGG